MDPLVSILIPAYNSKHWIADTIESALNQTWPHKEIIVVDDGSHDGTLAIAKRFESSIVKVHTQSNRGAAGARNAAYSLCGGDYIQWLDADDIIAPDKIAHQVRRALVLGDRRVLLSCPWAYFFYRTEKARFSPSALWTSLSPVDWLALKMQQALHMQPDTWLVSRELTDLAGPWDESLFRDNDGEYFCRVLSASRGIDFVNEAKCYYRKVGRSSVSYVGTSHRKLESLHRSILLHVHYLLSLENSQRTRLAAINYMQAWADFFYPSRMDLFTAFCRQAAELGGHLNPPVLPWRYHLIQSILGWSAASSARRVLPTLKESVVRSWDRAMYRLCSRPIGSRLSKR